MTEQSKSEAAVRFYRGLELGFRRHPAAHWHDYTQDEQSEWWIMNNARDDMVNVSRNPDKIR